MVHPYGPAWVRMNPMRYESYNQTLLIPPIPILAGPSRLTFRQFENCFEVAKQLLTVTGVQIVPIYYNIYIYMYIYTYIFISVRSACCVTGACSPAACGGCRHVRICAEFEQIQNNSGARRYTDSPLSWRARYVGKM